MNEWILPHNEEAVAEIERNRQQKGIEADRLSQTKEPANYVILDAALWDSVLSMAFNLCPKYCSLFATKGSENELDAVAPYLFPYTENTDFSKWLKSKEKKGLQSLYISSEETMEGLRKHLRRFLRVKTEEGKWLFFRLYDPYVVNTVFPSLSEKQLKELFHSVKYFMTRDLRINEQRIFNLHYDGKLNIHYKAINHVDNK